MVVPDSRCLTLESVYAFGMFRIAHVRLPTRLHQQSQAASMLIALSHSISFASACSREQFRLGGTLTIVGPEHDDKDLLQLCLEAKLSIKR